jgi:hypothetical protein
LPSRKRARTSELTSEEKREARAERNRIAAQCSRDRRKAQYVHLEKRVAELEAENALLRAGGAVAPIQLVNEEKERENQELRERVKMLEKAWENVAKVLQTLSGVTVSLESLASTSTIPSTVPVIPTVVPTSMPSATNVLEESTRHLARVATTLTPSLDVEVPQQRMDSLDFCAPRLRTASQTSESQPPHPPPTTQQTTSALPPPMKRQRTGFVRCSNPARSSRRPNSIRRWNRRHLGLKAPLPPPHRTKPPQRPS